MNNASTNNLSSVVEFLLAQPDVDPNIATNTTGYTPLINAAYHGSRECVSLLLGHALTNVLHKCKVMNVNVHVG